MTWPPGGSAAWRSSGSTIQWTSTSYTLHSSTPPGWPGAITYEEGLRHFEEAEMPPSVPGVLRAS